jgi:hypothetical protein
MKKKKTVVHHQEHYLELFAVFSRRFFVLPTHSENTKYRKVEVDD